MTPMLSQHAPVSPILSVENKKNSQMYSVILEQGLTMAMNTILKVNVP